MNALRDAELRDRQPDGYREQMPDYRQERPRYREAVPSDREISLGTGTILSIFFALALTCPVFFGFGYSMGRKSAQPAAVASEASAPGGIFSSFKPSAVNPLGSSSQQKKAFAQPQAPSPDTDEASSAPDDPGIQKQSAGVDPAPIVVKTQVKSPSAVASNQAPSASALTSVMPATNPNGTAMVQVAAVSHQEDADLLLGALKKRGYGVFIRQEAQDRLLHVQVGPFASRKDADVMRQRLLADGYNAIVK